MQAAQGFGRRGVAREPPALARPAVVATAPAPAADLAPFEDEALSAFQTAARAEWAQARIDRPRMVFWKQYPGMTALGVMTLVFLSITLAPLHMSASVLHWIRGGLGVSSLFGFGAKRLFRKKRGG